MIAWTVLEIACQEVLGDPSISYSFRKNLDNALKNQRKKPINWSQGIWQQVTRLQDIRKNYVHRFASESDLFPNIEIADEAIETVRAAVEDIFDHLGKEAPKWIDDNTDRGWDSIGLRDSAHLTVIRAGAREDDPKVIKVAYVQDGKEHISELLPPGTDYGPIVDNLMKNIRVPISMIRVYQGNNVVFECELNIRGT